MGWLRQVTLGLRFKLKPHLPAAHVVNRQNDKRSLLRLQRRLSTAFAAAGHPALRPHLLVRTSQMQGPLTEISLPDMSF